MAASGLLGAAGCLAPFELMACGDEVTSRKPDPGERAPARPRVMTTLITGSRQVSSSSSRASSSGRLLAIMWLVAISR